MEISSFENIIFDLGNVIINLDIEATDRAFKKLFMDDYDKSFNHLNEKEVFIKYEKGEITTESFLSELKELNPSLSDNEIKDAWNAMLKDIPPNRLNTLNELKNKQRIFCLSNTNEIHIEFIRGYLKKEFKTDTLNPFFEKVYYSHEIGMRKPDLEIFDYVLKENKLKSEKTLFIDDTSGHLEGAKKLGIHTFHMSPEQSFEKLFKRI